MSAEATSEVLDFKPEFNASYCGELKEKDAMMKMLHDVYEQKPWVPKPIKCSWGDEDCSQTKCCNNFVCKWDYSKCTGYQCYKKDANFAGCNAGKPAWGSVKLGDGRTPREIGRAKKPWLIL